MTGEIGETNFYYLREQRDPEQSLLTEYGGGGETTIAVVRKPNDTGIRDVCDEWMKPLGMPEDALTDFWELKNQYKRNDAIDGASNRAYGECRLDERYTEHVRNSKDAQSCIDEIVERVESGEDITLVCFEGEGQACHRHLLVEMVEQRLSSEFEITR